MLARILALFFVLQISAGSEAQAKSAKALNAFDLITEAEVIVSLYGAFGRYDDPPPDLWEGFSSRKEAFSEKLEREINEVLKLSGIQIGTESEDAVVVVIRGHQQDIEGGGILHVYSIELAVIDSNWAPENPCDDNDLENESSVIGTARNENLEAVLESEVLRLLKEDLWNSSRERGLAAVEER